MKKSKLFRRYLLGDLPSRQREELEIEYLSNETLFVEVQAAEDDLIDAYIRDELSRKERRQFEKQFLVSQERREKIALANALMNMSLVDEPVEMTTTAPLWQNLWDFFSQPQAIFQYGFGVVFLLVVIFGALELRKAHTQLAKLGSEETSFIKQNQELRHEVSEQRSRIDDLTQQLQDEIGSVERLQQDLARVLQLRIPNLSFTLSPGRQRDPQSLKTVLIPKNAQIVEFQLDLTTPGEYASYRARIALDEGAEIWSSAVDSVSTTDSGKIVLLHVPASVFSNNELYLIELLGFSPFTSGYDGIHDYVFHVFLR